MSILEEANETINGERQDQYGNPEDSFKLIGDYWTTYLGIKVSASDVAKMMALFKIARMAGQKHSRDNWRDAIGYLAIDADRLHAATPVATPKVDSLDDYMQRQLLDRLSKLGGIYDK